MARKISPRKQSPVPTARPKPPPTGTTTYWHRLLTPVSVAPGQEQGIPLPPEFIVPQDGHDKQECETAAAKRWLRQYAKYYRAYGMTIWGDALYSNHPLGEVLVEERVPFIWVCKPDSHPTLYEQLERRDLGHDLHQVTHRHHTAMGLAIYT